ncbi:hypothetical protein RB213_008987, partial [Colletotrichum asianum]
TGSAGSKIAHVEGIVRSASLCHGFARAVSFVWCKVREHDADWQLEQTFAASRDASRKGPGTVATAKTTVVRLENASKDEYWTRIIASTMWQGFVVKRAAARRSIRTSAASSTRNALSKTANHGDIGTRTAYGIIARSVMHLSVPTTESYDASTKTAISCVYPTVATVVTTNAPSRAIDKCLNFNDTGSDKLCYEHSRTELHKKIKHLEDRLRGRGYESHHYDDLKCRHDKLARDYDSCLLRLNESREEIRILRSTWISDEDNRIWRKDLEDRNARSARVDELFKKVEILQAMLAGEREQKDILLEDIAKRDEYDRCYRERYERRRWRRGSFERKRPFPERVERVVERERVYGVGC